MIRVTYNGSGNIYEFFCQAAKELPPYPCGAHPQELCQVDDLRPFTEAHGHGADIPFTLKEIETLSKDKYPWLAGEWELWPKFLNCPQCGLRKMGVAPEDATASFGTFRLEPKDIARHYNRCLTYASAPKGLLLLAGSPGTGKTHLAIAIMREQLRQRQDNQQFIRHRDFLNRHRESKRPVSFRADRPDPSPMEQCQRCKLLVYDDLSAATGGTNEDDLLELFDYRVQHYLPTVVTTNLTLDSEEVSGLERAIGSRLLDRFRLALFAALRFNFPSKRAGSNTAYLDRCP